MSHTAWNIYWKCLPTSEALVFTLNKVETTSVFWAKEGYALVYLIQELFLLLCWEQIAGGEGRSRETQQEVVATIQAGNDGGSDQRGSRGGSERWLNSDYLLKVEPNWQTEFEMWENRGVDKCVIITFLSAGIKGFLRGVSGTSREGSCANLPAQLERFYFVCFMYWTFY